ncbi:MAG: rubrerythrin family protein [Candidatus Cloacimonetes bacterium]|nr:rubrerythrin family protein [Candidatus Cloacimonadota bacterium]
MSIKGSRTSENLLKAFAGESQARNRYTYAAKVARKQGYEQIANIFLETAENERMHAKIFLRHLINNGCKGDAITITATYPAALDEEDTIANLEWAAAGEKEEWTELYPIFAEVADDEGLGEIATSFRMIAKIEARHETRYRKLIENIKNQKVFKKDGKVFWKCLECGYIHEGDTAPTTCPSCKHPQSYFELWVENY